MSHTDHVNAARWLDPARFEAPKTLPIVGTEVDCRECCGPELVVRPSNRRKGFVVLACGHSVRA